VVAEFSGVAQELRRDSRCFSNVEFTIERRRPALRWWSEWRGKVHADQAAGGDRNRSPRVGIRLDTTPSRITLPRTSTKSWTRRRASSATFRAWRRGRRKPSCANLLGCFLFSEDVCFKPDRGVERWRAQTATRSARICCCILRTFCCSTSPTNHLDLRAKDVLAGGAGEVQRDRSVRLARPLLHRQAGDARL